MVLGGALALALLLRVVPLTYAHFWDETVYLQHAMVLVDGRANYDEFEYRPPLLPFLYAVGFLAWNHIYAANVVQGLFTTLAVLFGFLHVRAAGFSFKGWLFKMPPASFATSVPPGGLDGSPGTC